MRRKATYLSIALCLALATGALALEGEVGPVQLNAGDFDSIQAALDALPLQGGTVVIPPGAYVLKKTLNLSYALKGRTTTIRLQGAGRNWTTRLILDTGGEPGIDLTGNNYCSISDLMIQNRTANVGILLSRGPGPAGGCGGHEFRNLVLHGAYPISCVYSIGAEVNRWYNCTFSNQLPESYQRDVPGMTSGDCFIFAAANIHEVKSPYVADNAGGCNTELLIHGCTISNVGPDSVGLRVVGFASDVRVYASYLHSDGFSAIYLDGTKQCLDNVALRDLRIEGEDGKHCLYAKGQVRNVIIEGGAWGANFEPIVQEDALSFTDLRYSPDPQGVALNWQIRGLSVSIHDGVGYDTGWAGHFTEHPEEKAWPEDSRYVFMRFDRLQYSYIECKFMVAIRHFLDENGEVQFQTDFSGDQETLAREQGVVVRKLSEGNYFIVEKKRDVVLEGEKVGRNVIVSLSGR